MRVPAILLSLILCAVPGVAGEDTLLKAFYTPVKGTDPEYGQVAIEKTDLPHREVKRFIWLILVPPPPDADHWQHKLNEAVEEKHGSFRVTRATAEEERLVADGTITFQH